MSGRDRYSRFAPYVPVAERRRKAEAKAKQMAKSGRVLSPVRITGRQIATTFWGLQWCANLGTYSDYANRLPRGRTYAGNGSIIDLQIADGKVSALVMGSSLYKIEIVISGLPATSWKQFKNRCAGRISSLLDLLQGRLDKSVLEEITRRPGGLFPGPREMKFSCSCPDGALMCKHVAATLYGVGARLDTSPELFFTLRSTDMQELISAAGANAAVAPAGPSSGDLDEDDLSALFGIEIEAAPAKDAREEGSGKKTGGSGQNQGFPQKWRSVKKGARQRSRGFPAAPPVPFMSGTRRHKEVCLIAHTSRTTPQNIRIDIILMEPDNLPHDQDPDPSPGGAVPRTPPIRQAARMVSRGNLPPWCRAVASGLS